MLSSINSQKMRKFCVWEGMVAIVFKWYFFWPQDHYTEDPIQAVCNFLQFVPLEDQILTEFFKKVATSIHQRLKATPCLPVVTDSDQGTVCTNLYIDTLPKKTHTHKNRHANRHLEVKSIALFAWPMWVCSNVLFKTQAPKLILFLTNMAWF